MFNYYVHKNVPNSGRLNLCRSMTIFAEANVEVDLRMLRSFRVLRPLKLVSRIPSKFGQHKVE
jgi:hypothetical protein